MRTAMKSTEKELSFLQQYLRKKMTAKNWRRESLRGKLSWWNYSPRLALLRFRLETWVCDSFTLSLFLLLIHYSVPFSSPVFSISIDLFDLEFAPLVVNWVFVPASHSSIKFQHADSMLFYDEYDDLFLLQRNPWLAFKYFRLLHHQHLITHNKKWVSLQSNSTVNSFLSMSG